jgi:hypothetical protein
MCRQGGTFSGNAGFDHATFTGIADFSGAALPSTRYASTRTSPPWTDFTGACFDQEAPSEVTRFVSQLLVEMPE